MNERAKITTQHLSRQAIYLRPSSASQVEHNRESTAKARELGWPEDRILVIAVVWPTNQF